MYKGCPGDRKCVEINLQSSRRLETVTFDFRSGSIGRLKNDPPPNRVGKFQRISPGNQKMDLVSQVPWCRHWNGTAILRSGTSIGSEARYRWITPKGVGESRQSIAALCPLECHSTRLRIPRYYSSKRIHYFLRGFYELLDHSF